MAKENLCDRVGEHVADLTDRGRLAVTEALMLAEKSSDGSLSMFHFGGVILRNCLGSEEDVIVLSDSVNDALQIIAARNQH